MTKRLMAAGTKRLADNKYLTLLLFSPDGQLSCGKLPVFSHLQTLERSEVAKSPPYCARRFLNF
ncbi:hypothetical protein PROFUN_16616 [Planoprotostelium fungivorum]|uniref:Uncharacterized protein n=1 Tax=Planoprotostelium fungivorum TaxID=1890364 RepID=A0A2P6MPV3_9EUKA|nr:hypothetical protein PROFUN_16616 [Planoprotostelium fungivorum]